jgi:hypothetical protein
MPKITRRSFAARAVAAVAVTAALPEVLAQSAPPPEAGNPTKSPSLPAASQAEVDARVNWIFAKYGARLDETQRADIRRIISNGQPGIDAMRAYPLENGDGPAGSFNPLVGIREQIDPAVGAMRDRGMRSRRRRP